MKEVLGFKSVSGIPLENRFSLPVVLGEGYSINNPIVAACRVFNSSISGCLI